MGADLKRQLRAAALAARAAVADRAAAEAAMARHLAALLADRPGAAVAAYWPIRGEADPWPGLARHDGPTGLPVVLAPATPLVFRRWRPGEVLEKGSLGTAHPAESAPVLIPDLVLVPLAGFDSAGNRLGYGGGFYDRTLQALRAARPVTAVGFAFAAQALPTIPAEATDQPLDLILTEAGVLLPQTG